MVSSINSHLSALCDVLRQDWQKGFLSTDVLAGDGSGVIGGICLVYDYCNWHLLW